MSNLQTLKGFRDFLPREKRKRDYVANKLKEVFERYGFEPLETPTLEYKEVIMGKYGDEADKLVYAFKDNGDRDVAMRYDQTVPTSRVLAQYSSELPQYFRRYQIQNVFRAEKPQKGRYREFAQCDIDIFGSNDPLTDAEVLACAYNAYKNVGFQNIIIKINDRNILFDTLKPFSTDSVSIISIIQSIDKLDKMSKEDVVKELVSKGLEQSSAESALSKIEQAEKTEVLTKTLQLAQDLGIPSEGIQFSPILARGLDYYNSIIWEVVCTDYGNGSLGGGGRYDFLIEKLGGRSTFATGMAFGFDRMVDAATDLGIIPDSSTSTKVLVTIFSEETKKVSLNVANELRKSGVATEVYVNSESKLGKQMKYADDLAIPYVIVIGPDEIGEGVVVLKDLKTGEQKKINMQDVSKILK